jgi:hypothetical protein
MTVVYGVIKDIGVPPSVRPLLGCTDTHGKIDYRNSSYCVL